MPADVYTALPLVSTHGTHGWISVPRVLRFSSTNMLNAEHMKVLGFRSLEYRGLQHCYFLNSDSWQEAASSGISTFFVSPAIFSFRTHIFVSKVGCTALVAGLESASWLVVHCTFLLYICGTGPTTNAGPQTDDLERVTFSISDAILYFIWRETFHEAALFCLMFVLLEWCCYVKQVAAELNLEAVNIVHKEQVHALSVLDLRCLTKILLLNILTILTMVDILFLDPFDTLLVVIRLFL